MRPRWLVVLVVAGLGATAFVLMPSSRRALSHDAGIATPVRGAFHVHTRRSDGTGTVEQVAAAASRAGLAFVILTDHGDASRAPEPPAYRQNVLVIDAVEISTTGGHVIALGLARSPYPLGGEPRDVVEDILRLGGMSIAAHPTSSKAALRWTDWSVPLNGLEWLNGDSEWRDETWPRLGGALLTYPFRRAGTLGVLLDRPMDALREWDARSATRPVVGIAGSDAHARLGLRDEGDPNAPRFALRMPSYEQIFRTFSISLTGMTLTSIAATDATAVIDAIRRGHVFSSIDALAAPALVAYHAESGGVTAQAGEVLTNPKQTLFTVETNAPPDARITLHKAGHVVATSPGPRLQHTSAEAGTYRAEVTLSNSPGTPPVPWIVTNPIYVGVTPSPPRTTPAAGELTSRYKDGPADDWRVEKSTQSEGAINVVRSLTGTQVSFRFALGGSEGEGPFAGLAMPAGAIAGADRLMFTATASRPLRLSVQIRSPGGASGQRWRRSVYLDETARTITVPFGDMTRVAGGSERPEIDRIGDVLFVIDTTNARPGFNGQIWIDEVKYGRP
jgi:hypothetical protein